MNAVKEYIEESQLQTRDNCDLIKEFEEEIAEMHGRCIDIGCGLGVFTRQYLLPKLPSDATVVGCDISRKMLDYAKVTNADEGRLSFIELDIQTEHLPQNQIGIYDNAVSFFCIHWCHNISKVFENIHQLLRPGGKSLILFVADHAYFDAVTKLQKNPKYVSHMQDACKHIPIFHNCNNSRTKLMEILIKCGFQVIHCSVRHKTFVYENLQTVKKFIQGINPFSERFQDNTVEEFENDFLREILIVRKKCYFRNLGEKCEILFLYQMLVAYVERK